GSKRARPLLPEAVGVIIAANFNRLLEARKAFFLIQIKTRPNHCQNATELARKDNPASPRNIVPAREAPEA
ncbi:hypothetical protein, partial [Pseudomonas sp. FSL R10-2398]|uniref:hypothetical protein n=1 Tax=Pseudomonas sp. FSL R10-2398 TaxID=2662201 RepID=UPI001C498D31